MCDKLNSRRSFIRKSAFGSFGLSLGFFELYGKKLKTENSFDFSKLGASTACLAGFSIVEALGILKKLGFLTVEIIAYPDARHSIGPIPGFALHRATEKEREAVYNATREFKHISAHLPFQDLHPFSSDADVQIFSINQFRRGIDTLAFLEGELAVIHPGWPGPGLTYKDIWKKMIDTFRDLGDYAGKKGIRIGLETMQPSSVKEFSQLIFEIDHPLIGATIDTGHIRGSSDIDLPNERKFSNQGIEIFNNVLAELVDTLGKKVFHYHLTDVRQSDWRDHFIPGTGIIDFPRLFQKLKQREYKGLLVFELEEPDQVNALDSSKAYIEDLMRA